MKDQKLKDTLNGVLSRVLEQTAFVFPESVDSLENIDPESMEFIQVSLSYSGSREGRVSMILPLALCAEFASNMLGQDPSECESRECRVDAAKEIANIVTGQLLTDLFGTRESFRQTAPDVNDLTADQFFSTLEANEYTCSMVDQYPVITMLTETGTTHACKSISR
jgi:chemotaxis protein CheY-P-specific phosphatase CheC